MGQASAELSNVRALVFLAALGLDVGESVASVQEPFAETNDGRNLLSYRL